MRHILFAALLLAPAPALAAPCTAARLTGTWSLVSIRAADPGVQQFYAQVPHEVMRFGARGDFAYSASNQPYTAASARPALDEAAAAPGMRFSFRIDGDRLMLLRNGQAWEGFVCRIADRAEGAARAGDAILTNLPDRPGIVRIQRRLG
jgi:hypothetical protein